MVALTERMILWLDSHGLGYVQRWVHYLVNPYYRRQYLAAEERVAALRLELAKATTVRACRPNQVGLFAINANILTEPDGYCWLFNNMVIVSAERGIQHGFVRYVALHPDFECLPQGALIPEYIAVIRTDFRNNRRSTVLRWQRKSEEAPRFINLGNASDDESASKDH